MTKPSLQLGFYLLEALYRRGARHLWGIPGDFVLNFFLAIEAYQKLQLISLSHEPGLGFAADGMSRITRRLTPVAVTFGAGALNTVNAIACAYAERSPLVVISGAPGLQERQAGLLFHHQAKTLESQRKIFREITCHQACLENPSTAASEIEHALDLAEQLSSPIYLELPRDLVFEKISPPSQNFPPLPENAEAIEAAAHEIHDRLHRAIHPVLMVGVEVHRLGLTEQVVKLAERLRIPVVSSFMGRCTFPVDHSQFFGTYLGPAGERSTMQLVEKSDALFLLGVLLSDTNMGLRLKTLKTDHLLHTLSRQVRVGHHLYQDIPLKKLLDSLLKLTRPLKKIVQPARHTKPITTPRPVGYRRPLTPETLIATLNQFFQKQGPLPVVSDNGDCLFASLDLHTPTQIASGYYATMGFAVPAGMGMQVASKQRSVILVGDGAFHMTGSEISYCPRLGINPIVIVFNNARWEMLHTLKPEGRCYDLPLWDFAELGALWGGRGFTAQTPQQLAEALHLAQQETRFVIIDAQLPKGSCSQRLKKYLGQVGKQNRPKKKSSSVDKKHPRAPRK